MRYDPFAYQVTWGKVYAGLMFWAALMVELLIWGSAGTTSIVANSNSSPGFSERYRHSSVASCATFDGDSDFNAMSSDAVADRNRS